MVVAHKLVENPCQVLTDLILYACVFKVELVYRHNAWDVDPVSCQKSTRL